MAWKTQDDLENSDSLQDSGTNEWPCKPIIESSGWATKWPNDSTKSKLQTPLPTPQDEAANNAQLPALLTVSKYLNSTLSQDDDEEFSEYIGEDGLVYFQNVDEGFQDYDFFVKLFKEDDGLRMYYEENKESGGVFCCLVCCGVKEKGWKRFKDCASLVQHAISIAKTSKRRAHRAYCKVVCEILGWDVNKLPAIVISDSDKGNADDGGEDCLAGQCKSTNSVSISDTEASLSKLSLIDESKQGKDGGSAELEHNSSSGVTVDRSLGDPSKGTPETTKENTEGVSNCVKNSVSKCKAGVDGLLEDLSRLTLEMQKGNAKGASDCVEPSKQCPVVTTEEKGSQKDDDAHKNHK